MAANSSFDITSTIDFQEVDNALNQARKEVGQRYDFKGAKADIDSQRRRKDADADDRRRDEDERAVGNRADAAGAARRRRSRTSRRRDCEPAAGGTVRRVIPIQQGIPIEAAREIVKFIKDKKLKKVQAAIQADQVRVSSPSKDELQDAMRALREHDFGVALQFGNYR